MLWRRSVTGVEVAIGSAAALSKVAISNGHCILFSNDYFFTFDSISPSIFNLRKSKMDQILEIVMEIPMNQAVY